MIPSLAKLALDTDAKRGRYTGYTPCKITLELDNKTLSLKFETMSEWGGYDESPARHTGWLWDANEQEWKRNGGEEVVDAEPVFFHNVKHTLGVIMQKIIMNIIKVKDNPHRFQNVYLFKWDSHLVSKRLKDDFREKVFAFDENTERDINDYFKRMKAQYEKDLRNDNRMMESAERAERTQQRRLG